MGGATLQLDNGGPEARLRPSDVWMRMGHRIQLIASLRTVRGHHSAGCGCPCATVAWLRGNGRNSRQLAPNPIGQSSNHSQ
jgi:hypothetical protein